MDQKANNTIGFSGIILSFVAAAGVYLIQYVPKTANYYSLFSYLFLFGVVFLVLSIFLALKASSVKYYKMFPEPDKFLKKTENLKKEDILDGLPKVYDAIITSNRAIINNNAKYISYSQIFLSVGLLLNVLFVMSMVFLKN